MSSRIKFKQLKVGEHPDWRRGDQIEIDGGWICDFFYTGELPIPQGCTRKFRRPVIPPGYKLPAEERIHLLYRGYWLAECLPPKKGAESPQQSYIP